MQLVHQKHETLRRSIPAGGSEKTRCLISPRTIERMFHDGQEFDMGEPHSLNVIAKVRCYFAIREGRLSSSDTRIHELKWTS